MKLANFPNVYDMGWKTNQLEYNQIILLWEMNIQICRNAFCIIVHIKKQCASGSIKPAQHIPETKGNVRSTLVIFKIPEYSQLADDPYLYETFMYQRKTRGFLKKKTLFILLLGKNVCPKRGFSKTLSSSAHKIKSVTGSCL